MPTTTTSSLNSALNPSSSTNFSEALNFSGGGHPTDPTKFHVDADLLDQVLDFGFEEYISTLAIERTNGVGVEEAVNWIIDHSNQSDLEEDDQEEDQNEMGGIIF